MELFAALGIGLLLGLRHAFDPDHLVAVTSILSRGHRVGPAVAVGTWWGLGHAATIVGVGSLALLVGWSLPEAWQGGLEFLVGITIVVLGFAVLQGRSHHRAANFTRSRRRAVAVGTIHGFAGSGPLMVLLALSFPAVEQRYVALLASAAGTLLGMTLATVVLVTPFLWSRARSEVWFARLQTAAGGLAIVYGLGFCVRALGLF